MQTVKTKFGQMISVSVPWRTVLQNVAAAVVSLVVLSWLRPRPLGLFFLALFFFWLYKTRCSFEIRLTSESRRKLKIYKKILMDNKNNSPIMHFVAGASIVILVAIVGQCICSFYGPLIVLCQTCGFFLFIWCCEVERVDDEDEQPTDAATNSDNESTSDTNGNNDADTEDDEDEEFVPETNKQNLAILEKASEITAPTEDLEDDDDRSDDIPSELLIPDVIPEVNENSTDEGDELIPVIDVQKPSSSAEPLAVASKIHFKKGHFKNDPNQSSSSLSSSSSEESLSKGLRFPDHTVVDGAASASTKHDQNRLIAPDPASSVTNMMVSNQLPNLIGGLAIKWLMGAAGATTQPTSTTSKLREIELNSDSSQESEFEFLDHE